MERAASEASLSVRELGARLSLIVRQYLEARLQFPAAYATYMANVLASSILGDLVRQSLGLKVILEPRKGKFHAPTPALRVGTSKKEKP